MSLMIPSISTTIALALSSSIEVLSGTSILRHIQSIFNAWRPLSLSVSHGKVRISGSHIWIWSLIRLLSLIVPIILFPWRWSPSESSSLLPTSRCLLSSCLCWSFFIIDLWLFRIVHHTVATVASSSVLALHIAMHTLVVVHLILNTWLNMLIFFGGWYCSCWPHWVQVLCLVPGCSCSLWASATGSEFGHFASLTLSVWVRSIIQPWFLMTLTGRAVAHDDSTSTLPTNDAIIATLILLLVLIVEILIVSLLRWSPPMLLLIVLSVIHRLFRNGFITSIVLPGWDRWVSTTLLVLTLQMLWVLLREGVSMLPTIVASHLCLTWRACIGHGDVIGSWASIADWAVLRGILRTSICIRGAASCTTGEFRWHVCAWLLSPIAVILLIVRMILWWYNLLLLCLLSSLLQPSFKAVFHGLSVSAWHLNSGHIDLWPLLPENGLIEFLVIITPPLRVDHGIEWGRARLHGWDCVALGEQEVSSVVWGVVWGFTLTPLRGGLRDNLDARAATTRVASGLI